MERLVQAQIQLPELRVRKSFHTDYLRQTMHSSCTPSHPNPFQLHQLEHYLAHNEEARGALPKIHRNNGLSTLPRAPFSDLVNDGFVSLLRIHRLACTPQFEQLNRLAF